MNCIADETEVGPCENSCGRAICLMRSECVRPPVEVKRNAAQKFVRAWKIRSARKHLEQLIAYYHSIERDPRNGPELVRFRQRIAVARVDLALAERP